MLYIGKVVDLIFKSEPSFVLGDYFYSLVPILSIFYLVEQFTEGTREYMT